ncbi:hypothetical protein QJS04_geneDACA021799 [Acorus gramineus]|uniref:Coiled-coil domain-containing protein SCD2 n=1 Tax=Acorus gramineus TaxID=55184 RepID=A0AAV9A531_ACOGR|nr:hypothetical protein QJS04_geneDACA021799 [Acorus gramineus]
MDRRRAGSPVYTGQRSNKSTSTGSSSPTMSSAHHRSASAAAGVSNVKRNQNAAAKAAAARLARVMASQNVAAEDDRDDDDEAEVGGGGGGGFGFRGQERHRSSSGGANGGIGGGLLRRPARSPSPALGRNYVEHAPSVRSTSAGRPSSMPVRTAVVVPQMVPPSRVQSLRTPSPVPSIEPTPVVERHRERRFMADMRTISREPGNQREASALQDELDMLQEENENILDKLRLAEERREEAEARARELEKQANHCRKEAALRQREAALKAANENKEGREDEMAAIRAELESAKDEATAFTEQLREAESEAKALRMMTQRMILTEEEMEEVVLKRCWLARYWGLAVQHGIYPDIAVSKHEHWSSFAPLPLEVVLSAGQKAKEESLNRGGDDLERSKLVREMSDITGEGNIESMLLVEKALRELASLKVEDAVALAMSHHRHSTFTRQSLSDPKSPGDPKYIEAFELSQEEVEDTLFKQAWLAYFWRRAKTHGVEEDVAEECLQFWVSRSSRSLTSHDAVDVERGLMELRKLSIEQQLWETSRREIDASPHHKPVGGDSETSP